MFGEEGAQGVKSDTVIVMVAEYLQVSCVMCGQVACGKK